MSHHHGISDKDHLLRAALLWARRGWHVFPCAPGGKPPGLRDADWRELSTTDPVQITGWWAARPWNIGIDCGKSGLVVIDLDVPGHGARDRREEPGRKTGLDALLRICTERSQPVPEATFSVSTPSGGYHFYYAAPPCRVGSSTGRLDPLIDVRAAGGYVIAPGSLAAGRAYTVINPAPPAPMPAWLAELHEKRDQSHTAVRDRLALIQHCSAYAMAALRSEAQAVAAARRYPDAVLNRSAFKLGQLISAGLLTEAQVSDVLAVAAADTSLTAREISRTIDRGLDAGKRSPRQASAPAKSPRLRVPPQRTPGIFPRV